MGSNEQLIRRLLEAWNRRDLESVAPLLASDFEWIEWEESLVDAPAGQRGARAIELVTEDIDEGFEGYRADVVEYQDLDSERALVIMAERAQGSASGADVSTRFGYLVTVRDGKVARVVAYRDPDAARAAGGAGQGPRPANSPGLDSAP